MKKDLIAYLFSLLFLASCTVLILVGKNNKTVVHDSDKYQSELKHRAGLNIVNDNDTISIDTLKLK